ATLPNKFNEILLNELFTLNNIVANSPFNNKSSLTRFSIEKFERSLVFKVSCDIRELISQEISDKNLSNKETKNNSEVLPIN
ncbi:MAG: hypothetical protein KGZ81_01220, partial [Flavobacteriales bacterium]|nr:hypothetical protein [Flavobacteriales bacterium]